VVLGEVGEIAGPESCTPLVDGRHYAPPTGLPPRSARSSRPAVGLGCATGPAPVGLLALALGALGVRRRR
jgi:MYXO-CTERM domain-containing protein